MKFFAWVTIAMAFVAVHAGKSEKMKEFMNTMKTCGDELSIDMSSLKTGGYKAVKKIFEDNKDKCLSKCILTKYGVIDESNNLVSEKAEAFLQFGKPTDMSKVTECFNKFKDTAEDCRKYSNIHTCFIELKY